MHGVGPCPQQLRVTIELQDPQTRVQRDQVAVREDGGASPEALVLIGRLLCQSREGVGEHVPPTVGDAAVHVHQHRLGSVTRGVEVEARLGTRGIVYGDATFERSLSRSGGVADRLELFDHRPLLVAQSALR